MAQIFRCDLCGSLAGKEGLTVRVGVERGVFGSPVDTGRALGLPVAHYTDLCLACAQRIVNFLDDRASGKKEG